MALLQSELIRLKAELGFNVLSVGAEPYISIVALFDQVIGPYMTAGATTTSSTIVAAQDSPTPVTLTLASSTGFTEWNRVVVDVDGRQEIATARLVSGAAVTLDLKRAHTGTYPVTVEGGESIVREYLARIASVKDQMASTFGEGQLKKVDEIEFYQSGGGASTLFGNLGTQLSWWRDELASILGIRSGWQQKRAGGQRLAVY
jgi:hypothetical protein